MTTRELLQMALTALERGIEFVPAGYGIERQQWETIEALRAHLAKPEPEPIGEVIKATGSLKDIHIIRWADGAGIDEGLKLYTKEQM